MGFLVFLALIGIICVCCNKSEGFDYFVKGTIVTILLIFIMALLTYIISGY